MKKTLSEMSLEELWQLFPIILKEHNPDYKEWYLTEKNILLNTLSSDTIKRINHIGSTSVKDLIAKPTVDILLEIDSDANIEEIKSKLIAIGWGLMSSSYIPELHLIFQKGYTPEGFAQKVFHLHIRLLGDWNELYFRDYLLMHDDIAEEYGNLKKQLKEKYEHNRDGYTEAKTEFIMKYTKLSREYFGDKYLPL